MKIKKVFEHVSKNYEVYQRAIPKNASLVPYATLLRIVKLDRANGHSGLGIRGAETIEFSKKINQSPWGSWKPISSIKVYSDEDEWYYIMKSNILLRDTNVITYKYQNNYRCDQFDGLMQCIENEVTDKKFEENVDFYQISAKSSDDFGTPIDLELKKDIISNFDKLYIHEYKHMGTNVLRLIPINGNTRNITDIKIKEYQGNGWKSYILHREHYLVSPFDGQRVMSEEEDFTCFEYKGLLKCIENEIVNKNLLFQK